MSKHFVSEGDHVVYQIKDNEAYHNLNKNLTLHTFCSLASGLKVKYRNCAILKAYESFYKNEGIWVKTFLQIIQGAYLIVIYDKLRSFLQL